MAILLAVTFPAYCLVIFILFGLTLGIEEGSFLRALIFILISIGTAIVLVFLVYNVYILIHFFFQIRNTWMKGEFFLYLRAFGTDKTNDCDNEVLDILKKIHPVVAIGNPKEMLTTLNNANMLYVSDDEWKDTVARLKKSASLIAINVFTTDALYWEMREAQDSLDKLLIIVHDTEAYHTMCSVFKDNDIYGKLPEIKKGKSLIWYDKGINEFRFIESGDLKEGLISFLSTIYSRKHEFVLLMLLYNGYYNEYNYRYNDYRQEAEYVEFKYTLNNYIKNNGWVQLIYSLFPFIWLKDLVKLFFSLLPSLCDNDYPEFSTLIYLFWGCLSIIFYFLITLTLFNTFPYRFIIYSIFCLPLHLFTYMHSGKIVFLKKSYLGRNNFKREMLKKLLLVLLFMCLIFRSKIISVLFGIWD